jgi:amidohydrolase
MKKIHTESSFLEAIPDKSVSLGTVLSKNLTSLEVSTTLMDDVITLRHDLHAHPELGFEEQRTASIIAKRLRILGYEVHEGIAKTGIVGLLRGPRAGKTIMLRADMDALPLFEENDVSYRSTIDGKMHACGHDGHVAILLGAAAVIAQHRAELVGTIILCFQPAEEGLGGAQAMIEDGLLERFGVEHAYGLHLTPSAAVGVLGFQAGPSTASCDSIEVAIHGDGGHGADPHLAIDSIVVAAEFISAVQKVVSRRIDPLKPAVVTIGAITGGATHNVIPRTVLMKGTVRTLHSDVRAQMPEHIERVLKGVCDGSGASYEFCYNRLIPVLVNNPRQTSYVQNVAARAFGVEHIFDEKTGVGYFAAAIGMGAEDFALFAERIPSCYFTLGSCGGERTGFPLHHGRFDLDDAALETGVRMMAMLALDAPQHARF